MRIPYAPLALCLLGLLPGNATTAGFESWKQQQQQAFNDYLTAEQRAFRDMLRTQWQLQPQQEGEVRDSQPKPVEPPRIVTPEKAEPIVRVVRPLPAQPVTAPIDKQPAVPVAPMKKPAEPTAPQDAEPRETPRAQKPAPESTPPKAIVTTPPAKQPVAQTETDTLRFYGHTLSFPRVAFKSLGGGKIDNNAIADYWATLVQNVGPVRDALVGYRQSLALSDWATFQLTSRYVESKLKDRRSQPLLVWTLLLELGYDARVAYQNNAVAVLLATQQNVYFWDFITRDNRRYYLPGKLNSREFYVYSGDNPATAKAFDLGFARTVAANAASPRSEVVLRDALLKKEFAFSFNQDHASYFRDYPAIPLGWYFQADIEASAKQAMRAALDPVLRDMPQDRKIDYLLTLVQHGYAYETDEQQWGREYYVAPEHMLGLTAADCEDRSFLFAWLVREFADADFIGLLYPGHVAVAVEMDKVPAGADTVRHNGKTYVVADPTYIGAPLGEAMPQFDGVKPEVITL